MTNDIYTKSLLQSMSIEEQTNMFDSLLLSTGRPNIEVFISWLHGTDFYTSPQSANGYGNYKGGLLYHSLCVYNVLKGMVNVLKSIDENNSSDEFDDSSLIMVGLLHDICLVQCFSPVEKRKLIEGSWVTVHTYDYYDQFPLGHGDKSILFVTMHGVYLNREEMLAIKWHGGPVELNDRELQTYYSALRTSKLARLLVASVDLSKSYMEENREFEIIR